MCKTYIVVGLRHIYIYIHVQTVRRSRYPVYRRPPTVPVDRYSPTPVRGLPVAFDVSRTRRAIVTESIAGDAMTIGSALAALRSCCFTTTIDVRLSLSLSFSRSVRLSRFLWPHSCIKHIVLVGRTTWSLGGASRVRNPPPIGLRKNDLNSLACSFNRECIPGTRGATDPGRTGYRKIQVS